jgi:hypothetical protein
LSLNALQVDNVADQGTGKSFRGSNSSGQIRLGGVSVPSMALYAAIGLFALLVLAGVAIAAVLLLPKPGDCAQQNPVCGIDGITYDNPCLAQKAGVSIKGNGSCVMGCVDSDGGKDTFTSGSASKGNTRTADQCSGKGSVVEAYCADDMVITATLPCPAGYECSDGACAKSSCSDSDNGIFQNVRGTVVVGSTNSTDVCASSSAVDEFYCKDGAMASVNVSCGAGMSCIQGACAVTPCNDSDGGKDASVSGTVTKGSDTFNDKCDNLSVIEYYCEGGAVLNQTIQCPSGFSCSLGKCKEDACTDTDNGMDQFIKGTAKLGLVSHTDSCYSPSSVLEYYCSANKTIATTTIPCGSGDECVDGKCQAAACASVNANLDTADEEQIVDSFGSSDPLVLVNGGVVRINNGYILELYSIGSDKDSFRLYRNISEYRGSNELCSLAIGLGNSSTSMCGKTINRLKVVNITSDNTTLQITGYSVTEYFSQNGQITDWTDSPACPSDIVKYDSFAADFFPYIDTNPSLFNQGNSKFRLFDGNATLKTVTGSSVKFFADGRTYTLSDGDSFTYKDKSYAIALTFVDYGLRRMDIIRD